MQQDRQRQLIAAERLSGLIGTIYDCAIDPTLWPDTIAGICGATDCCAGIIAVMNLDSLDARLIQNWNHDPDWLARLPDYAADIAARWNSIAHKHERIFETPGSSRREMDPEFEENNRYTREMLRPFGYVDSIHLFLMNTPSRYAELGMSRDESAGLATDRDLEIARLLLPHVRRAVTISDLLDM
jgi:hypothetical protein